MNRPTFLAAISAFGAALVARPAAAALRSPKVRKHIGRVTIMATAAIAPGDVFTVQVTDDGDALCVSVQRGASLAVVQWTSDEAPAL
jgi:hypothetical protein